MLHDLAVEQLANKSNDEYYKEMITELCTDREIETLIGGIQIVYAPLSETVGIMTESIY